MRHLLAVALQLILSAVPGHHVRHRISCRRRREETREPGYVETQTRYYQKFVVRHRLFGIPLPAVMLLDEEIPSSAVLQDSMLGFTDWKSAAPAAYFRALGAGWSQGVWHECGGAP